MSQDARIKHRAIVVCITALGFAARLPAQSPADVRDGHLCHRLVDDRDSSARDEAQRYASHGGPRAAFFTGCLRLADGKADDASRAFDQATLEERADAVCQYWLGRADAERAKHANIFRKVMLARRTRGAFERAVELAPDYLDPRAALVEYALEAPSALGGGVDNARAQAAEITRRNPYRGGIVEADIALHQKDVVEVERLDESLIQQYPDSTTPRVQLIGAFIGAQKWSDAWAAVDDFERALPTNPVATLEVGRVAAESGEQLPRGERALHAYVRYAPEHGEPSLAVVHYWLGELLEGERDVAAARQEYRLALASDPTLTSAKRALERLR